MKFSLTVDRGEDGVWIVECPVIPGCVSQGATREAALENVKDAVRLCLEVRAEPSPVPDRGNPPDRGDRLMGSRLPVLSGRQVAAVFEHFGWHPVCQSSSHVIMIKTGEVTTLSLPDHKEVARRTCGR